MRQLNISKVVYITNHLSVEDIVRFHEEFLSLYEGFGIESEVLTQYTEYVNALGSGDATLKFDAEYCSDVTLIKLLNETPEEYYDEIESFVKKVGTDYALTPKLSYNELETMRPDALIMAADVILDCAQYGFEDLIREKVFVYKDICALSSAARKYRRLMLKGRPETRQKSRDELISLIKKNRNRLKNYPKRAKETDTFRYNMSTSLLESIDSLITGF